MNVFSGSLAVDKAQRLERFASTLVGFSELTQASFATAAHAASFANRAAVHVFVANITGVILVSTSHGFCCAQSVSEPFA